MVGANPTCTAPSQVHTIANWFNPCAFALVPAADVRPGNAPNGAVRQPGLQRWDISLFKNTKMGERLNLQFRAEAFNVFNHTNPDEVGTAFEFFGYGQVLTTRDPRIIQLGLKLYY